MDAKGDLMKKTNAKKYFKRMLFILLVSAFVYSIYINLGYRHFIKQSQERNYAHLRSIAAVGDNSAHWLEEFVQIPIEKEDEWKDELYNSWRVVNGESRSINSYLSAMSVFDMGEDAPDWNLLQYSLFRVDGFINGMTDKFLENQSYRMSKEETERIEAVITVYSSVSEELEKESVNVERLLESIKEPMLVIDDYYADALEKVDSN
jgi:hypothetical protein